MLFSIFLKCHQQQTKCFATVCKSQSVHLVGNDVSGLGYRVSVLLLRELLFTLYPHLKLYSVDGRHGHVVHIVIRRKTEVLAVVVMHPLPQLTLAH